MVEGASPATLTENGPSVVPGGTGCVAVDCPYPAVSPYSKDAVPAAGSGLVAVPARVADVGVMALAGPVTADPGAAS